MDFIDLFNEVRKKKLMLDLNARPHFPDNQIK